MGINWGKQYTSGCAGKSSEDESRIFTIERHKTRPQSSKWSSYYKKAKESKVEKFSLGCSGNAEAAKEICENHNFKLDERDKINKRYEDKS